MEEEDRPFLVKLPAQSNGLSTVEAVVFVVKHHI